MENSQHYWLGLYARLHALIIGILCFRIWMRGSVSLTCVFQIHRYSSFIVNVNSEHNKLRSRSSSYKWQMNEVGWAVVAVPFLHSLLRCKLFSAEKEHSSSHVHSLLHFPFESTWKLSFVNGSCFPTCVIIRLLFGITSCKLFSAFYAERIYQETVEVWKVDVFQVAFRFSTNSYRTWRIKQAWCSSPSNSKLILLLQNQREYTSMNITSSMQGIKSKKNNWLCW